MYFKLANYSIVVYHLKNILLNFQRKISKTKPLAANLRRLLEKRCFAVTVVSRHSIIWNQKMKLFLLFYEFTQVTLSSFFLVLLIFQVLVTLESEKRDFRLKIGQFVIVK